MQTLTIAIASTGRPSLVRCLTSIAAIQIPVDTAINIVIADDSPDGKVVNLLRLVSNTPFPIAAIATASHNVSIARNACLDAATGDLVAFVDDDEWVEPNWMINLFAAMHDYSADCVFGPVHPVYPTGTPAWIVSANPLHVDWGRRGRIVTVGRGGNTLLKRAIVEANKIRFDPALGRTGGEDTSFFNALSKAGAHMVVTDDALVYEDAPPARVNIAYFRHRALRTGQIYGRFVLSGMDNAPAARGQFYVGALIKASVALGAGALFYPFDRSRWLKFAMRGWMNVGKLRELIGLAPPTMR
jgi:succinoglycan biosynthesis protein ExoM